MFDLTQTESRVSLIPTGRNKKSILKPVYQIISFDGHSCGTLRKNEDQTFISNFKPLNNHYRMIPH